MQQNGATSASQSGTQVKRTAIADIKTGLPVFQTFNSGHASFQHFALAQQQVSPALNYSQPINIPLQYAPYISLPCNIYFFIINRKLKKFYLLRWWSSVGNA